MEIRSKRPRCTRLVPTRALLLAPILIVAGADVARAAESKAECVSSFEEVQLKRRAGELRAAREAARACSGAACVDAIRNQCVAWYDEIDKAIPSLVFQAKKNGEDAFDVRVTLDGKVVATKLDGRPIEVDPGPHKARFEIEGAPPVEQNVLVAAGDKNRMVTARFGVEPPPVARGPVAPTQPAAPPPAPPPPPPERPVPAVVYVLGGVGVAALASFAVFGALGASERSDLKSSCEPLCTSDQVNKVRTKLVVADVSLGVGVVALGAAAYFLVTRPERPSSEPRTGLDVQLGAQRGFVSWTGAF